MINVTVIRQWAVIIMFNACCIQNVCIEFITESRSESPYVTTLAVDRNMLRMDTAKSFMSRIMEEKCSFLVNSYIEKKGK